MSNNSLKALKLVTSAIHSLKETNGSSPQSISKYLERKYKAEPSLVKPFVMLGLVKGINCRLLKNESGLFRLNPTFNIPPRSTKAKRINKRKTLKKNINKRKYTGKRKTGKGPKYSILKARSPKKPKKQTKSKKKMPKKKLKKLPKKVNLKKLKKMVYQQSNNVEDADAPFESTSGHEKPKTQEVDNKS